MIATATVVASAGFVTVVEVSSQQQQKHQKKVSFSNQIIPARKGYVKGRSQHR